MASTELLEVFGAPSWLGPALLRAWHLPALRACHLLAVPTNSSHVATSTASRRRTIKLALVSGGLGILGLKYTRSHRRQTVVGFQAILHRLAAVATYAAVAEIQATEI